MASRGELQPVKLDEERHNAGTADQEVAAATEDGLGACGNLLALLSLVLIVMFFPFSLLVSIKIVKEYERAVILRLGRLTSGKAKGPGLFFILPCLDSVNVVDLRTVTFDVPPQEILTKDQVTARVDAVVYFRVADPIKAIILAENYFDSTFRISQSTLRDVLGTKSLSEILSDREAISDHLGELLDTATDRWGVKVERVEMKDVGLPADMQRSFAAEAEADREAKAKLISAEGEQRASRKLKEAADVMDESPATLQLRYLQTLNTISSENNHTYVFPLPLDLLGRLFGRK